MTQPLRHDFTATGYVFTPTRDKVLLIFHKKFGKWLPAGGHMDPNELPHCAALREVLEETGVRARIIDASPALGLSGPVEAQIPAPCFILHERIPATAKEEMHMHIDFIYLMEADEGDVLPALAEVDKAGWFSLPEVMAMDAFESVKRICTSVMGLVTAVPNNPAFKNDFSVK